MKPMLLAFLAIALSATASAQILYVDNTAAGANNGSSWANAYTTLTEAIDAANASTTIKEIRLAAQSTYTGTQYFIRRSYDITGGWNKATNIQSLIQADASALDGEQVHRILYIDPGHTVQFSGLHFLQGRITTGNGGGLYNSGNLTITSCYFENNVVDVGGNYNIETSGNGGAIYNEGRLVIRNSLFFNNRTTYSGGAIINRKELTVSECRFERNNAGNRAGALMNNYYGGVMRVSKSRFTENFTTRQDGTNYIWDGNGGAIVTEGAGAILVNCIFDKNKAHAGGAFSSTKWASIRNCTFYANEVYNTNIHGNGGAIYSFPGWGLEILNNIFWDNITPEAFDKSIYIYSSGSGKAAVYNCTFPAGTVGPSQNVDLKDNLNDNPLWVDAANGDFHLAANSPVINKGLNAYNTPADEPGDFNGQLRISPCVIDMGAVEYQLVNANGIQPDNQGILYVNTASTYNSFGDKGSAWNKALPSLADALLYANTCESVREVHVAQGHYQESTLNPGRGYIIKGSYDPATNTRDWKAYPTIIKLKPGNTSGRLMNTESIVDRRPITLDGLVFQDATQAALINYPNTELIIANCTFYRNTSDDAGGAISNLGTIRLVNGVFIRNHSNASAGALANYGTCTLVNATFNENTGPSQVSHVIHNYLSGTLKIQNSIITNPRVAFSIYNHGNLELNRNIIQGYINVPPLYVNGQSIDRMEDAPLFINAANNDLRLSAGSPAINKGDNALYEAADGNTGNNSVATGLDMASFTRVYDGTIDLGAYERQMKQQALAVAGINAMYGDAPVEPGTTTTTTLPVQYASINDQIAEPFTDTDNKAKIRIKRKGTVTVSASQAGDAVYDPSPSVSFTVTVAPKPITVTANAQSKEYGQVDPTLDYAVAPALVAGDAFTGALSRAAGEAVGPYAIGQGSLLLNDNYLLTYTPADLTIHTKAIALTLDAKAKTYGEADPPLTYSFTPALAFNDAFAGALTRAAGEDAGTYAIQNGLTLNSNYTVTTTGANLVINPKAITVTAADKRKTYGDPDPALTYTVAPGLVGSDVLNGAITRTSGEDAGSYPITQGSLANNNYTISFVPAQLIIDKAAQQITWNQALLSACDGNSTIALTATSSSGLPVVYQSANTAVASVSNHQLSILTPGRTTITAMQPGDHNYLPAAAVQQPLTSRLPAHLLVKRWNDVLVFDNHSKDFNGWQWYKNGQAINGATGQYLYESGQLNGSYYAIAQTTAGESLPTCPVTLTPGAAAAPLTVFPNPTGPGQPVTLKTTYTAAQLQGASLILTNNTGAVVTTINQVTPQTTLNMPLIQGLYVVRLQLATGVTHAVNVLVKP